MEGFQLSNPVIIKSIHRQYSYQFIDDLERHFEELIRESDFLIIDQNVFNNYNKQLTCLLDNKRILINASEETKLYNESKNNCPTREEILSLDWWLYLGFTANISKHVDKQTGI